MTLHRGYRTFAERLTAAARVLRPIRADRTAGSLTEGFRRPPLITYRNRHADLGRFDAGHSGISGPARTPRGKAGARAVRRGTGAPRRTAGVTPPAYRSRPWNVQPSVQKPAARATRADATFSGSCR